MTLGTSNKKSVYALIILGVGAAYSVYTNLIAGPDVPGGGSSTPTAVVATDSPIVPVSESGPLPPPKVGSRNRTRSQEFHPELRSKRGDKPVDLTNIDPTLRTDLFRKVQAVELAAAVGKRNLFQFGAPPPPPKLDLPPEVKVKPFAVYDRPKAPPPPPPPPGPKVDPPPPPIPLKYYAFWIAADSGKRTACFMADKEEIVMAAEGETIKSRYRVVRISPTSVVMEDLNFKKQQTLQLAEEAQVQGE